MPRTETLIITRSGSHRLTRLMLISAIAGATSAGAETARKLFQPVTERLFSGFRIEGNTIINPGGYGILLRNTRNAGEDVIDQIKFAADQGFTSWEDNGMGDRPPELQEKIGKTLSDLGLEHGKSIPDKEGILAVIEAYRKFEPR